MSFNNNDNFGGNQGNQGNSDESAGFGSLLNKAEGETILPH
jgi:hypothetical protein